jgi:hypothetical protein
MTILPLSMKCPAFKNFGKSATQSADTLPVERGETSGGATAAAEELFKKIIETGAVVMEGRTVVGVVGKAASLLPCLSFRIESSLLYSVFR